jgi:hypothetical protein
MRSTILICLFFVNFCVAQSEQKPGLSTSEFERAKSLYIKMMESDDYKKKEELNDVLFPILSETNGYREFLKQKPKSEEAILEWIKNNVAKDKVERATNLFTEAIKLEAKVLADNKETFELYRKGTRDQQLEILKPFFEKSEAKHGF